MMNNGTLLNLARALADYYHFGQTYGTNQPYLSYHVEGVVNQMKVHNLPEEALIVAYLHDIIEDTACTIEIVTAIFGPRISSAVLAITKNKDETREDYLARCAKNKLARLVKFHDAVFNATNCIKNKNTSRYNYYIQTISALEAH